MDVSLPDGTVIKGVPDGMSKGDLVTKLKANGHDVSWYTSEAPPAPKEASLGQRFMQGVGDLSSAPEVLANLGTGALGQAAGGIVGGVRAMFPGPEGVGAETSQKVADALTYQPRNQAAKAGLELVSKGMGKANEVLGSAGEAVGGNVGRSIGENALPVAMAVAPLPKVIRNIRENPVFTALPKSKPTAGFTTESGDVVSPKDVQFARENQGLMDAAERARKHGIAVNPEDTNPTLKNRIIGETAGNNETNVKLSQANQGKWNNLFQSDPDIGIAKNMPMDEKTLAALRNRAGQSSEQIAQMGTMYPTEGHLSQIEGLRQEPTIGGKASADEINKRVNETLDLVRGNTEGFTSGTDASKLLKNVQKLRSDARTLYKDTTGDPVKSAAADANMKLANILEDMVDTNLKGMADKNPYGGFAELSDQFKNDRRTMAKSYAMEDALDLNTKQIDPHVIAKVGSKDNALTGHFEDAAKIVGNFPDIAQFNSKGKPVISTHLSRNVPLALGGGLIGSVFGPAGYATGAALGMGASELTSRILASRASGAAAQARGVSPVPRSLWDLSNVDPLNPRPQYGDPNFQRDMGGRGMPPQSVITEAVLKKLRSTKEQ